MTSKYENILLVAITIALVVVIVTLLNSHIDITFNAKIDSLIIVFGNLIVASFIAFAITKRHKNEELKIGNCFKELDNLLELLAMLRTKIAKNKDLIDNITRFDSLTSLQIQLIKKYSFINEKYKEELSDEYYKLNISLTDSDIINDNYKMALLRIEEIILNIKSDIL